MMVNLMPKIGSFQIRWSKILESKSFAMLYFQENEQQSFDSDTQDSTSNKTDNLKHLNLDSDNDSESIGESGAKPSDPTLVC